MNIPNRNQRRPFRTGVVSASQIMADIAASGVPDDTDKTGTMGIRDTKELRENAKSLFSSKKKK